MDLIKRVVGAIFDFLQGIVVILAIMVMIYLFIMSPQEINGASMEPNFHNGEYILTNKIEYKLKNPARGDVVIFKSPSNKEIDYIKRIIGLPGEEVLVTDGRITVRHADGSDELALQEDYIRRAGGDDDERVVLGPDEYFVAGDNRGFSFDSRDWGPLPSDNIVGLARLRLWPARQAMAITAPVYE